MNVRSLGKKLLYLTFRSNGESVQVEVNQQRLNQAADKSVGDELALLKRGDHISVTGVPSRNKRGELILSATTLPETYSPSLSPIPFSLTDEENRVKSRHLELLTDPTARATLVLRSRIIQTIRSHFLADGFVEVQTPIVSASAGGALARPFTTRGGFVGGNRELALRIAPELWLKRLVVGGLERVFEIGPAFRNEGVDNTHNPEFTMCEFYQAWANLDDLMGRTEQLVRDIASAAAASDLKASLPDAPDPEAFAGTFERVELIPALEAALGSPLPDLGTETAAADLIALVARSHPELHAYIASDYPAPAHSPAVDGEAASKHPQISVIKLIDRLAEHFIEPLSATRPIFITHHPAITSPLSKSFVCPHTGQPVAARAELFFAGRELANMYEEENDPAAQRRKFLLQLGAKDDEGGAGEVDEGYVEALRAGLPPTGGWGCGVDRLVMMFSGSKRISDVLSFGSLRNVVGLHTPAANRGSSNGG